MSDLVSFEKFPSRLKRYPNESLVGFVYRVLSKNGHRMSTGGYYAAVCRLYARDLQSSDLLLEKLSATIGEPDYCRYAFWQERAFFLNKEFSGSGTRFPRLRSQSVWFCGECLKEEPIHKEFWVFPLAKTCLVHGERLTSTCRVCGRLVHWGGLLEGWRCKNGHKIYDGHRYMAKNRERKRDQFFSIHPHFSEPGKTSYFDRYHERVTFHELYAGYLTSLAWAYSAELKSLPTLGWGIEGFAAVKWESLGYCKVDRVPNHLTFPPPLTFLFVRWFYLSHVITHPVGMLIKEYVSTIAHTIINPSVSAGNNEKNKAVVDVELNEEASVPDSKRVAQLKHVLIHIGIRVPLTIGLSALQQFDQWWERVSVEAYQRGLVSATSPHFPTDVELSGSERTQAEVFHEKKLACVMDLLVFAACMDLQVSELEGFCSGIKLPAYLQRRSRKRPYKRVIAHLMKCDIAEVKNWCDLLQAGVLEHRRRLCEQFRERGR